MKKTLLCTALIAALSACDNPGPTDTPAAAPTAPPAQAAKSHALTGAAQAEAAETLFKKINAIHNQTWKESFGAANPLIISISSSPPFYQRGEQGSSAESTLSIVFSEALRAADPRFADPLHISMRSRIDHADTLADEGIIAKTTTQPVLDAALKSRLTLSDSEAAALSKALEYLQIDTTYFADDTIEQIARIKPIDITDGNDEFRYEGFELSTTLNDTPAAQADNFTLRSGAMRFKDSAGAKRFSLEPFNGSIGITPEGKLQGSISAIRFSNSEHLSLSVGSTHLSGDNLVFNKQISQYLGKVSCRLDDINIQVPGQNAVAVKQALVEYTGRQQGNLYDFAYTLRIEPISDFIKDNTGIADLKINNASFSIDYRNIGIKTWQKIQSFGANEDLLDAAFVQSLLEEAWANGSELHFSAAADTQSGKADANIQIRLSPAADKANIKNAAHNDAWTDILEIQGQIRIAKAILQRAGVAALMEKQIGPYLKTEGDDYLFEFSLKNGLARLNGQFLLL